MIRSISLIATLLMTTSSFAHDPSEHMKGNKKPNCAAMDHSKMDINNPVDQAMMKQCSVGNHHNMKQAGNDDMHSEMHEKKPTKMKNYKHVKHQY